MKIQMPKKTLAILLFTLALAGIGFGLIVPFLPSVARRIGASEFVATLLATTYAVGMLVSSRPAGDLSDRYGRRPVLLVTIGLSLTGMVMLWLANSIAWLFVARALGGLSAGASSSVVSAYVADVTTKEERTQAMGLMMAMSALGLILGPVLGGLLEAHSPLAREGAFSALVGVGLTVINFILIVASLPESLPRQERAIRPVALSPLNYEGLKETFRLPGVPVVAAMMCTRMLVVQALVQTYRMFTEDEFGLGPEHTGYVLGMFGTILLVMQGLGIRALLKLASEKRLLFFSLALEIFGYLLFPLVLLLPYGSAGLYVANAVIALGAGVTDPCLYALGSKFAPAPSMGATLGTIGAARALGNIVGPMIHGALYQEVGHTFPYFASSVFLAVMVVLSLRLPPIPSSAAPQQETERESEHERVPERS